MKNFKKSSSNSVDDTNDLLIPEIKEDLVAEEKPVVEAVVVINKPEKTKKKVKESVVIKRTVPFTKAEGSLVINELLKRLKLKYKVSDLLSIVPMAYSEEDYIKAIDALANK